MTKYISLLILSGLILACPAITHTDPRTGGLTSDTDAELAGAYYQSGLSLFKQNKFAEAIAKFSAALESKPDFSQALFKLGECYDRQKNKTEAIKNYRLAMKQLESKADLSPEEKSILPQVRRNLEKLDTTGSQLKDAKNKHIDNLCKLANECLGRRYSRFALEIYNQVLALDPNNKTATDAITRIGSGQLKSPNPKGRKEKSIFNGTDMTGWTVNSIWLQLWSVEKPCLVFNRPKSEKAQPSKEPSVILLAATPPQNYILSMEVFIEKRLPNAQRYCINFMYGETLKPQIQNNATVNVLIPQELNSNFAKVGSWEKLRFIKNDMDYIIEGPGTTKQSGVLNATDKPQLGFYAQGFIAKFRNITLKDQD